MKNWLALSPFSIVHRKQIQWRTSRRDAFDTNSPSFWDFLCKKRHFYSVSLQEFVSLCRLMSPDAAICEGTLYVSLVAT